MWRRPSLLYLMTVIPTVRPQSDQKFIQNHFLPIRRIITGAAALFNFSATYHNHNPLLPPHKQHKSLRTHRCQKSSNQLQSLSLSLSLSFLIFLNFLSPFFSISIYLRIYVSLMINISNQHFFVNYIYVNKKLTMLD